MPPPRPLAALAITLALTALLTLLLTLSAYQRTPTHICQPIPGTSRLDCG